MSAVKLNIASHLSDEHLIKAPNKLVEKLRLQVRSWAAEDGILAKDLKKYMLDNVNVELETLGYSPIGKL